MHTINIDSIQRSFYIVAMFVLSYLNQLLLKYLCYKFQTSHMCTVSFA